jgi:hypothetical protein
MALGGMIFIPNFIKIGSVNPDRNMKNKKFGSRLSTYFKRHMGFRKADESLECSEEKKNGNFFDLALLRSKAGTTCEPSIDE